MNAVKKCFICGNTTITSESNDIAFCSSACMYEYWRKLHEKYRTKVVKKKIATITGKDLTKARGDMTKALFATQLGISVPRLTRYENGAEIPVDVAVKIEAKLKAAGLYKLITEHQT